MYVFKVNIRKPHLNETKEMNAVFRFVVLITRNLHLNRNATISQGTRKTALRNINDDFFIAIHISFVLKDIFFI